MTRLSIEPLPGAPRGRYRIDLDGTDIGASVTELDLNLTPDAAEVTLELAIFDDFRADLGNPIIIIGAHTTELLQKLGWTPPPEALEQQGRDQQAEQ